MFEIYEKSRSGELLGLLRSRAGEAAAEASESVKKIIADVRASGDDAVRYYTEKFDGVKGAPFWLDKCEIEAAARRVDEGLLCAMRRAAENIRTFHERQRERGWAEFSAGKYMGQRIVPLKRVGVYAPGGTAAYPSTVLMTAIPAKVAGVEEIILATPPKVSEDGKIMPADAVLCAAWIAGVDRVLLAGGAQAVAALAYGTESIPRVDKIVGPGNIYVAEAKRQVWGAVDIDMIAGPSEVLVIADESANPRFAAADLLSQAEHDPLAAAVLVTTSAELAGAVNGELKSQLKLLPRREIAASAIERCGAALVVDTLEEAAEFANEVAPEHLELMVKSPEAILGLIRNAGSVFIGAYSPEPLGDYYAGPNHVLPTAGTARFSSGLSWASFVKRMTFVCYDKDSLVSAAGDIIRLAEAEGLEAHARAVKVRLEGEK